MDIATPLKNLGPVDMGGLRDLILAQDDAAWHEDRFRQEAFEVHQATQSIVLLFIETGTWPHSEVRREPGWPRLSEAAVPLMDDIIRRYYPPGGTVIRAMAAKLVAGGSISPHVDRHPSFHQSHRIHIPITTNPRVRFMIDGRPHQLQVGEAYEINNQKTHSVMNKGRDDRITFIFDYAPDGESGIPAND